MNNQFKVFVIADNLSVDITSIEINFDKALDIRKNYYMSQTPERINYQTEIDFFMRTAPYIPIADKNLRCCNIVTNIINLNKPIRKDEIIYQVCDFEISQYPINQNIEQFFIPSFKTKTIKNENNTYESTQIAERYVDMLTGNINNQVVVSTPKFLSQIISPKLRNLGTDMSPYTQIEANTIWLNSFLTWQPKTEAEMIAKQKLIGCIKVKDKKNISNYNANQVFISENKYDFYSEKTKQWLKRENTTSGKIINLISGLRLKNLQSFDFDKVSALKTFLDKNVIEKDGLTTKPFEKAKTKNLQ